MNFHTGPSIVSLELQYFFFGFLIASSVSAALILDEWPTVPLLVLFERQDLHNPPIRTFSTRLLVSMCEDNDFDEFLFWLSQRVQYLLPNSWGPLPITYERMGTL